MHYIEEVSATIVIVGYQGVLCHTSDDNPLLSANACASGGEGLKHASPGFSMPGVIHGRNEAWMFIGPHGPVDAMVGKER